MNTLFCERTHSNLILNLEVSLAPGVPAFAVDYIESYLRAVFHLPVETSSLLNLTRHSTDAGQLLNSVKDHLISGRC